MTPLEREINETITKHERAIANARRNVEIIDGDLAALEKGATSRPGRPWAFAWRGKDTLKADRVCALQAIEELTQKIGEERARLTATAGMSGLEIRLRAILASNAERDAEARQKISLMTSALFDSSSAERQSRHATINKLEGEIGDRARETTEAKRQLAALTTNGKG